MWYTVITIDPLWKIVQVENVWGEKNANTVLDNFKFHGGPQRHGYVYEGLFDFVYEKE